MGYRKVMIPALELWDVLGPQMKVPMFHEDNQAMILVVMSGRNPTMRHLGRVHRVSVQWLHERLGKHPDRDTTVLFYDDTHNMSADVYTKGFPNGDNWDHALHLINVFHADELTPEFLSNWVSSRAYYDRSEESKRVKEPIVSKAGHSREVQRTKAEEQNAKAQLSGAPAVTLGPLSLLRMQGAYSFSALTPE